MKKKFCILIFFLLNSWWIFGEEPVQLKVHITKYKHDKQCAISYTFDDGLIEQYTLTVPELEKYGFRGTFWVCGAKVNPNDNLIKDTTRLSWDNIRDMINRKHEVSSHSWSHRNLVKISREEAIEEITKNDSIFLQETGIRPKTFCYPFNAKNTDIINLASENRVGTRTKQFSLGGKITPEKLEQTIENIIKNGDWGVTMTHGITYGYDAFRSPSKLWDNLKKVKAMEDIIWVGTFCEVASYIKEREATQLEIKSKKGKMIITPVISLDPKLFTESLTASIENKGLQKFTVKQGNKKLKTQVFPEKILFDFDPFGKPIRITYN